MSNTINQKCHTSCRDCDFAIYTQDNRQIGCHFNILDNYQNKLIYAYDNQKDFFIINDVECLYKRTSEDEKEGKKQAVAALLQFKDNFQVIVYCDKFSVADFNKTADSIINSTLRPKYVTFMVEYGVQYYPDLFLEKFQNTGINWRVEAQLEPSKGFRYLVDHLLVSPNHKKNWYVLFEQGTEIDKHYFNTAHIIIDVQRFQILLIKPIGEHNYLTVHKNIDGFLGGNRVIKIEEKIDNYIKESQLPPDFLWINAEEIV